jgi:YHS domain-containing protein
MLRFIILIILAYLAYRVIKGILFPIKTVKKGPDGAVIDEMVRDPVCDTYIPRREAVSRVIGGQEYFFCSETCAKKFLEEKTQK